MRTGPLRSFSARPRSCAKLTAHDAACPSGRGSRRALGRARFDVESEVDVTMGRPTMLFVFAHPDDESFSGAGTAMKYAALGVRNVLLTATRGERGKCGDPALCRPEDLGPWRERELRTAADIIGFDELHVLDYRDRELTEAPPEAMRRRAGRRHPAHASGRRADLRSQRVQRAPGSRRDQPVRQRSDCRGWRRSLES